MNLSARVLFANDMLVIQIHLLRMGTYARKLPNTANTMANMANVLVKKIITKMRA